MKSRNELAITNTVKGSSHPLKTLIVNFDFASLDGSYSFNIVDAQVRETFRLSKCSIDLAALVNLALSRSRPYALRIRRRRRHFDRPVPVSRHWHFETGKDPLHQRAPRAHLTAFGWYKGWPIGSIDHSEASSFHGSLSEDKCDFLLKQLIDFDSFGNKPNITKFVSMVYLLKVGELSSAGFEKIWGIRLERLLTGSVIETADNKLL